MPKYEKGDYIKVEFPDETTGVGEWMWVRVDYADDTNRPLDGWLDSQPVVNAADLRLGQHLAISYDNIRQHEKSSEFDLQ